MAELKTQQNQASVKAFLARVEADRRREDALAMLALMSRITGETARMWGTSIVGFGNYHYQYASGREGDYMLTGFSPRKHALTLYIMTGFSNYDKTLSKLGKFKIGKSCLYIKKLADVDLAVLEKLIKQSVTHMRKKYPE